MLVAAGAARAQTAPPAADTGTQLEEIVVTAQKRSEDIQKVPISMQALSPETLSQHQVQSLDDYTKLLPSVSFQSFGPGQSQLYFRGITSGGDGLHLGSQPASGFYVDETPLTTIGNTPDMHVYDIARVEALSGPQGTLFGASSLSGTLRIITNQPDPTRFSAAYDVQGTDFTGHGAGGTAEGYVNVPLSDAVAIRLVGFYEHDGGYISNVAKTRTFTLDPGSDAATGDTLTENNSRYAKKDFNTVDTYGGRAALRVDLNDNWTVTPGVIYQHQKAEGNFLENPALGDLNAADFAPDLNVDEWYQAFLTIKGKIANWDVLYSGGYFGRTVANKHDYSYYTVAYDKAGLTSYVTFPDGHGGFLDPDQRFSSSDRYSKLSNEFRVSSPVEYPFRVLGGVFAERQTDLWAANYFIPGLAATGSSLVVPDAGDDVFFTRLDRIDRDFAVFGEAAYDILPNLTLTAGGRYFTVDNTLFGFSGTPGAAKKATCVATTTITDVPCANVNAKVTESGETHKANLAWRITPSKMIYVTYSTGFRPGGVNRQPGVAPYNPDTVTNYEFGLKSTWLDGRLRANGAIFDELWHGLQYAYAPLNSNGTSEIVNAGNARSYGLEGNIAYRATERLTLSASGTVLHASLTTTFCSTNDCAPAGTRLPVQPKYKVDTSARYEFMVKDYNTFVEGDLSAQGQSNSALFLKDEATLGPTKPFATLDFSGGFGKDNWDLEVFLKNVTDSRGVLRVGTDCSIQICGTYALDYITKPRQVGIKLSQKF
jgi:iron complex outermembrane receptor protein